MNIKVSDLKRFATFSSHIKGAGVLPIQDYLKFGSGVIQKEVTASFIKFNCGEATEELLVDEKILFDLVRVTPSEFINISFKKGKVYISDTRDTIGMQVPEIGLFVDIPTLNEERHELSKNFLEAIGSAAQVCQNMGQIPDKYMYVMIGNKGVTGISVPYGYYRPIEESVIMSLEKKIATFISKSDVYQCSVTDSHYIFYSQYAVIGFARQEIGYGDFGSSLKADPGKLTFTSSNSDIKSYNSLAMSLNKEAVVTMKNGALEMYDSLRDIPHDRPIESITPFEDFPYVPEYMNNVLSALGSEELDFYQKPNMMIIKSSETNAVAAIGKINKI